MVQPLGGGFTSLTVYPWQPLPSTLLAAVCRVGLCYPLTAGLGYRGGGAGSVEVYVFLEQMNRCWRLSSWFLCPPGWATPVVLVGLFYR